MKKSLVVLFLLSLFGKVNGQSWPIDQAEILIENHLSHKVFVKVYPSGSIFSGWLPNYNLNHKYSLKRSNPVEICHWQNPVNDTLYISGGNLVIDSNNFAVLDFDDHRYFNRSEYNDRVIGGVSFGLWKFEFFYTPDAQTPELNIDLIADCLIDYRDFNYGLDGTPLGFTKDIYLTLESDSNSTNILLYFNFENGSLVNINDSRIESKTIKWWHQVGRTNSQGNDPFHPGSPNRSLFKSLSRFTTFPIYATEYGAVKHLNPGDIDLNLMIDHDIRTRDTLKDTITNITVKKKAAMIINSGKTFNMITPSFGYNNLIVEDTAFLVLYSNGKINVNYPNRITLKSNSNLTLHNNSEINIIEGGFFCNEGGKIRGPGNLIFKKGLHGVCPGVDNIFKVEDSAKIVLDDSAIVIFPDNFTLHLRGNTTSLIMKPGSKMMFGENSGIVCDSGAKVIANSAVFTSFDSTKKWNGISLKHRSHDTIKNCMIKNADFGVNIMNKNDDEGTEIPYSAEISGCSFVNQTSHVLNNGIYAAGSSIILIKNNTISSNILTKGFDHGIYAELCDGGYFNIIGNTISNSGNGMSLFNSSPFVSQNTVNGNQYSESGIFISGSYGKFEYNIINDFYYTYYSLLSSPDLLKNVFNSSYYDNICLSYSSVPNMHPVISGGSAYWISGDNHFTGSPSNAGIFFEDESYPNMAFGYNRFTLTNNDYYINGTNPTGSDTFDVRENYWGTLSPDQYKINIENSEGLLFNPYDDNSSEQRSVNNYTLYDIGFGLYDTVFFQESDDPGIAQELYLEAYQKEHSGEFQEAIEIYKEIISDYPDNIGSSFQDNAVSSLSRIFICNEKKNSTVTEYGALQNYYSNIFNDTSYTESQRNLSEDFIIKTKVKQNNIEEAISDYNTIYLNNINTSKGMHALINREILNAGEGDNFTGGSGIENLESKQTRINGILSALINKRFNILSRINTHPESFVLSQNYPNPFNPVTKITFSIPVSGNISIKVYDITGKEIKTLVNEFRNAGTYDTEFNGSDLSSGVYYYKMETGSFSEIKKMILIK